MEISDEPHALGIASPAPRGKRRHEESEDRRRRRGRERSRHRQDLVRAGLDVTFIEQWPAHAEAMRTNGVWVVMPDETLVTHVRAVHSGGSGGDWMKGRRGEGEDINGLRRAGAAPPRPPRARERGADRNRRQDRERSVVRLAFERRPPEVGARGLGRSLQMTRRGGARGGRTRWPGLRTQSS